MNGKTVKEIRRIAKKLPTTVKVVTVKDRVLKSALPPAEKERAKHIEGKYVMRKRDKLVEVDHVKEMKRYYKEHGRGAFLKAYMDWLVPPHLDMQKRFPDLVQEAKTQ